MRGNQSERRKIAKENLLTQEDLKKLLRYNPRTGNFFWKERPAGSKHSQGYVTICIGMHTYKAHRLAWLFKTGKWPAQYIDHKNGRRNDNRWKNLRLANYSENCMNRKKPVHNRAGFKGVCYYARNKKWAGYIYFRTASGTKGKEHLGLFNTPEEAHTAVKKRRKALHGAFARN